MLFRSFCLLAVTVCCTGTVGDDTGGDPTPDRGDDSSVGDANSPGDTFVNPPGDTVAGGDDSTGQNNAAAACVAKSAAIAAATGNTIVVSPAEAQTLRQIVSSAQSGDTIVLEDGTYSLLDAGGTSYTGLYFTQPNVTLRSASGNADAVILDSNYVDHGGESGVITIAASGIVLADFTVQRSIFHLVHLWTDGDSAVLHNLRLIDGGQQFVKASAGSGTIDDVEVTCSEFLMTTAGRDNVWGYGPTDGGTRCYTGGIDTHDSRNWLVADSRFEGIYCNAGGVPRPAHGKKADLRGFNTYLGGLAEHAIHMWDSESGSAHTIERNQIINCARGIGIGMSTDVYGTLVRNNMVFSEHAGSSEHDVGINIDRPHDVRLFNNTVFFSSPQAYANAIEYRWPSSNVEIRNNLTNQRIYPRDGATATLSDNVENAQASWFTATASGDLHLADCSNATVVNAGQTLADVADDIDGETRAGGNDIGADQCSD